VPNSWKEEAESQSRELFDLMRIDGGIKSSRTVRLLVNTIWAVAHGADDGDKDDALINLAVFSGMACAALHDYANLLENGE
jgi:hypothetical protein